nr:hypothetical protein [Tanacetum cinerariifolium]
MQTQTSNTLYNAIMEAGSKEHPPMLAPGNYVQWKSRIKRYIDTKPNHELIHYCLMNPPYKLDYDVTSSLRRGALHSLSKSGITRNTQPISKPHYAIIIHPKLRLLVLSEGLPMIDQHHFNAESDLVESMLNRNSSVISSSLKIDSLFDEFVDELTLLKSIPPGIDKADCHPENEIRFSKRLLYDNSSPRSPKEFVFENSNAEIESFSPSPIPIEDSDSHMEEIDLSFNSNDPMPPSIEDDDDSEGDILFLERLLHDDPIPLLDTLDFSYEVRVFLPFFIYPVTSPVLLSSGSEDKIFDLGITINHSYSF